MVLGGGQDPTAGLRQVPTVVLAGVQFPMSEVPLYRVSPEAENSEITGVPRP